MEFRIFKCVVPLEDITITRILVEGPRKGRQSSQELISLTATFIS